MNGLHRLQDFLIRQKYDSFLLMSPSNLHYFSGFTGTTGIAWVTPDRAYLITDSRYTEQAEAQCEGYTVKQHTKGPWELLTELVLNNSGKTPMLCGFEGNHITYDDYSKARMALGDTWTMSSQPLELLRAVKREDELVLLRKAANIGDQAFAQMLQTIKSGMTEDEVRIILESAMLHLGSSEPSFATIIASGKRSSMPHGVASDKIIEEGDFVTFDFGAVYQGYHSDMTRTIVVGKASEEQRNLYQALLTAQILGVNSVKAGITGSYLDGIVRTELSRTGLNPYFTHGLGHGVGLDIHEEPVASPKSNTIFEENMIVTVEPGVYFPGKWGLRIEDSVVVQKNGCEILTKTTKELIEV